MTRQELEMYANNKAIQFVKQLNNRYKEHISNDFMTIYLTKNFIKTYLGHHDKSELVNIAYNASITLFETYLEYGCSAGGNGHHVAQSFSDLIKEDENN